MTIFNTLREKVQISTLKFYSASDGYQMSHEREGMPLRLLPLLLVRAVLCINDRNKYIREATALSRHTD